MKFRLAAIIGLLLTPAIARSQTVEHIDPQTGNYVPQVDSFMQDSPTPDAVNPNRINARLTNRVATSANPSSGATAATQTNNQIATSTDAVAQPLVSMDGMPAYTSSSDQNAPLDNPFAKPDWWPQ